jgi:hypothetical protein
MMVYEARQALAQRDVVDLKSYQRKINLQDRTVKQSLPS